MIKAIADCRNVHSKLFYLDQNLRNFVYHDRNNVCCWFFLERILIGVQVGLY